MNQHPTHSGEYLAQECLDQADGDWSVAFGLILEAVPGDRRENALSALALWAALNPPANDNG